MPSIFYHQINLKMIVKELLFILLIFAVVESLVFLFGKALDLNLLLLLAIAIAITSRFVFSKSNYYIISTFILLSCISSLICLMYWCNLDLKPKLVSSYFAVLISLTSCIVLIPNLSGKNFIRVLLVLFFILPIYLSLLLFYGYYLAEHNYLRSDALLAIVQTNLEETSSYLLEHFSLLSLAIIFLVTFAIISAFIYFYLKCKPINDRKKYLLILILLNLITIHHYEKNMVDSPLLQPFLITKTGIDEYAKFQQLRKEHKVTINKELLKEDQEDGLYVLVIGESETRQHMSAYGYTKDTTPWLDSLVKNKEAILFNHAYSSHTYTLGALSFALTDKNQYNNKFLANSISLVEVAKAAGYKVIWISNQVKIGLCETPTSIIADLSDQQIWLNRNSGGTVKTDVYDGDTVDHIKKEEIAPKTLIVIHLMGSHFKYTDRYPNNMMKYPPKSAVDEYDNTVYYNDFVMSKLYNKVKDYPNFKGLLYFSDHGEDVDNGFGHNGANFTPAMVEIPLYLILSKQYQKDHPQRYENILNGSKNIITNDLLYNTLLGIMGIRYELNYEAENDITSQEYNSDTNRFRVLNKTKRVSDLK